LGVRVTQVTQVTQNPGPFPGGGCGGDHQAMCAERGIPQPSNRINRETRCDWYGWSFEIIDGMPSNRINRETRCDRHKRTSA
jgi:hypothetical protein